MPPRAVLLRLLLSLSLILNGWAAATMPVTTVAHDAVVATIHSADDGAIPPCHSMAGKKTGSAELARHADGCATSACTCHCANLLPAALAVLFVPHRIDPSPVRSRAIVVAFDSAMLTPSLRPPIA
jgi:hypothetical protein